MWLREWTLKRAATIVALTLLVPGAVGSGIQQAAASDCTSCGGSGCVCPAPEPRLETMGGQSLFWHDPCGSSYRDDFYLGCYEHDSCPPKWFASAEVLPLFRDQSGSTPFQVLATELVQTVSGQPVTTYSRDVVLSSSDFDTEFEPGIRAVIGRALGDWYRVEFSYFGSYSWADVATVQYGDVVAPTPLDPVVVDDPSTLADESVDQGTGNLLSPFSNFGDPGGPSGLGPVAQADFAPIPGLDYNELARISFSSRLDSAEVNLRRRLCMPKGRYVRAETSCLVGLRYMKVSEEFGYFSQSPVPVGGSINTVDVSTDNDLFGPQLGAMAQFLVHDQAWIDAEIKGALLFNQATTSTVASLYGQAPGAITDADENATAFLGDLSVNLNYQFAPAWTIRAGYNAFWLTGVALASENAIVNSQTLVSKPEAINHSGNVVYHGPSLGIVWAR